MDSKDYDASTKTLQLATTIYPESEEAWRLLAMSYGYRSENQMALDALKRACEIAPNDPVPLGMLAVLYHRFGQTFNYDASMEKLRNLSPQIADETVSFLSKESEISN